jgi:hypothetical protein
MKLRALAAAVAAIATVGLTAGPSVADPKGDTVPLDCGADGTYLVAVHGNGRFTPGHDTASTLVLVPVGFTDQTFTATAPDGTVLASGTDADAWKGQVASHNPRRQITCTFTFSFPADPSMGFPPGTTVTFAGTVVAYLSPGR